MARGSSIAQWIFHSGVLVQLVLMCCYAKCSAILLMLVSKTILRDGCLWQDHHICVAKATGSHSHHPCMCGKEIFFWTLFFCIEWIFIGDKEGGLTNDMIIVQRFAGLVLVFCIALVVYCYYLCNTKYNTQILDHTNNSLDQPRQEDFICIVIYNFPDSVMSFSFALLNQNCWWINHVQVEYWEWY